MLVAPGSRHSLLAGCRRLLTVHAGFTAGDKIRYALENGFGGIMGSGRQFESEEAGTISDDKVGKCSSGIDSDPYRFGQLSHLLRSQVLVASAPYYREDRSLVAGQPPLE